MNRDTWGIYGSQDCKTPNIDRLAREGMRFDQAHCTVAMCAPFRQELYSGCSPWRTGTLPNHSKSKSGTKSIVHYLQPLGYRVALVGKGHVGPKESYPFEYFPDKSKTLDQNPFYLKTTRSILDASVRESKPFCLFIASHDGHGPYTTGDPAAYDATKLTIPPYWLDTQRLRSELVQYYAEITNFDQLVGQVRRELEARGLWKNTLLMVCSEQGTSFPFAKWTCYDNGLHTGLVAHWPEVIKPGSVAAELVSIADITPTLVEAAGGKLKPNDCDGQSFFRTLQGEQQTLHDYVFGAFTNCNISGNRDRIYPIRVIKNKSFSLIYNPNHASLTSNVTLDHALSMLNDPSLRTTDVASSWVSLSREKPHTAPLVQKLHHRPEYELYHLTQDPYELINEINHSQHQTIVSEMKQQLHARLAKLGDTDPIATERTLINPRKARKAKLRNQPRAE
jgi:uncharacterized sulfatase